MGCYAHGYAVIGIKIPFNAFNLPKDEYGNIDSGLRWEFINDREDKIKPLKIENDFSDYAEDEYYYLGYMVRENDYYDKPYGVDLPDLVQLKHDIDKALIILEIPDFEYKIQLHCLAFYA